MKKMLVFLLSFLVLFSCSKGEEDVAINKSNGNDSLNLSQLRFAVSNSLIPMYRLYNWETPTSADHIFWCEKPSKTIRHEINYIGGAPYKYEGIPFYIFAETGGSKDNDKPTLGLYKKYDPSKVNNYLYTLKDGESDNYPGIAKLFNGYIYSEWRGGLVPLKEYYSEKEKDSFYTAVAENSVYDLGLVSGNYRYVKTLGYVIPGTDFHSDHPTGFNFSRDIWTYYDIDAELYINARDKYNNKVEEFRFYFRMYNYYVNSFEVPGNYIVTSAILRLFKSGPLSSDSKQTFTLPDLMINDYHDIYLRIPINNTNTYLKQRSIQYNNGKMNYYFFFDNPV